MRSGGIDLDDLDRSLLRALTHDATLSAGELGRRLGLSQPAAWRRVKRLEAAGVIAGRRLQNLDSVDVQPFLARLLGVDAPRGDGRAEDTLAVTTR